MNIDEIVNYILDNPENIKIEYSNINGKETFLINGEDVSLKKPFDDSDIKKKIKIYKNNLNYLDEWIWNLVLDQASELNYDLVKMNEVLNLDSYTEEDADLAFYVIQKMNEVICDVIEQEIQSLSDLRERF